MEGARRAVAVADLPKQLEVDTTATTVAAAAEEKEVPLPKQEDTIATAVAVAEVPKQEVSSGAADDVIVDAIASMIRKTNDVQEGTTNGVQEGSGVISDDPEYNPIEDEVVVHKTVKALKTASKKRKSSEASAAMPPGRVMAPPPGQTKRILEPDGPDRVTRQKATMAATTDHQESLGPI
ncbi:hypothetical protein D1007_11432 [Hordeum vulgare]|nr:hypothetical protein D1007_11432 [Hordeum vulgare]